MEIRNNSEALKAFLRMSSLSSAEAPQQQISESATSAAALAGDHATLSQAASEVSQSVVAAEERLEKVSEIQKALAAGTYSVPASKVADSVIDAMLTGGFG